jgi:hypothetical protein
MRARKALLPLSFLAGAALSLLVAGGAEARSEAEARYSKAQTFSAALRYLRVDLDYEVVEKDPEAAYLIFKYAPPGQRQSSNGTMEIVASEDRVRIYVKLPKMPEYHERVLRDGLLRKLREEYGEPPSQRPKPAPPEDRPPGDAGPDSEPGP